MFDMEMWNKEKERWQPLVAARICKPAHGCTKRVRFFFFPPLVLADVEGLEPAEPPLSAPAQNVSSVSDGDEKEATVPEDRSPGCEDTVAQSER